MKKKYIIIGAVVLLISVFLVYSTHSGKMVITPKVISTSPGNGSQDVDPAIREISVTFSEPMTDKNWSWSYEDKNKFPLTTGEPYYTDNFTRCVLPVKLEPKKEYIIWINTAKLKNFKSENGIPVEPYKLTFKTR